MFVTAKLPRNGEISRNLVEKLLKYIVKVADAAGDNFDKIEKNLTDKLRSYHARGRRMARRPELLELSDHLSIFTHVYDEPFFPEQKGHMRVVISFDRYGRRSTYEFSLIRRNAVKTLKNLALKAASRNVCHSQRINKMDIPETLKMSLMQDFHNDWIDWARKGFPRKTYWLPYAESLKRKKEISELVKKLPIAACIITFLTNK